MSDPIASPMHKFTYVGQPGMTETGVWECTKCGKRNPKNKEWYDTCIPDAPSDPEGQAALFDDSAAYLFYDPRQFQTKPRTPECIPTDSTPPSRGTEEAKEGTPTAPDRPNRFPTREVARSIKSPPEVTPVTGGVKHDQGKPRWDLLPFDAVNEVAKVLTFGANKYASRNWEKGMDHGRLHAAALRHLAAWGQSDDTDAESGLPHLAHAATCVLMLLALQMREVGEDTRGDTCST